MQSSSNHRTSYGRAPPALTTRSFSDFGPNNNRRSHVISQYGSNINDNHGSNINDNHGYSISAVEPGHVYGGNNNERRSSTNNAKMDSPMAEHMSLEDQSWPLPANGTFITPKHVERRQSQYNGPVNSFYSANKQLPLAPKTIQDEYSIVTIPIFAELRTNVIVKDEASILVGLSSKLSKLYQCSEDAIVINIEHSACVMLGGSFDPAYILNISTAPKALSKQNNEVVTKVVQDLLHRLLGVNSTRGMLKFKSFKEEDIGFRGETVANINQKFNQSYREIEKQSSTNVISSFDHQFEFPPLKSDQTTISPPLLTNTTNTTDTTNTINTIDTTDTTTSKVIRQQISSMSMPERRSSIISEVSEIDASTELTNSRIGSTNISSQSISTTPPSSPPSNHQRIYSNEMQRIINENETSKKERPLTTIYINRPGDGQVTDWRPTAPSSSLVSSPVSQEIIPLPKDQNSVPVSTSLTLINDEMESNVGELPSRSQSKRIRKVLTRKSSEFRPNSPKIISDESERFGNEMKRKRRSTLFDVFKR